MSSADRRRQEKLLPKDGATSMQGSKRARRCLPTAADIATIQEVQTSKMCLALCEFLESYSVRDARVIVSNADAERAWKACRGRTAELRVVLGELVDVRRRRGVVSTPAELEAYEKDFLDRFGYSFRRHVAFECSMLQTAGEDEQGRVKWRDLTCQDADDFDEFLKFATLTSDVVYGDTLALVPFGEEMAWHSPVDMCALQMGADVGEKKLAKVLRVEASAQIENLRSLGVCGRTSVYEERIEGIADRTRSKLKSRGESVAASVPNRGGRPKKMTKTTKQ